MNSKFSLLLFLFPLCVFAQITQIGADIDGEASEDKSGWSVSLSDDGSIVAISARLNDGINGIDSGHVRVYENTGGMWTQIGDDIDGEAADDRSGYTIGLNSNGSIIAVGASNNDGINGTDSGHVRIYQNIGGVWTQVGADIDGEAAGDFSSSSLSLNSDGSIVAIGATFNNGNGQNSGHVRVFQNTGGTWMQIGEDIDGESTDDYSGFSVSLNDYGNVLAIGAILNDGNGLDSGHVRIYQNTGGSWSQMGSDINGEAAEDESGHSVSLSADGSIVAIGAINNDENGTDSGHVRLFDLSSVLGIEDTSISVFSVYPSPTSGILNIISETPIFQITIYNLLGQLVLSFEDTNTIDISSVDQGVYFVKVMDENGYVASQKVVKK